uniref:TMEM132 domain-containing protein n=1 Tax=Haemonchus placei TaxID=6290 RepID=A0A0N4WMQ6_HAEPC
LFYATVVDASNHTEESILTPVVVPRIGDEPVVRAIFLSPSYHLHCVNTCEVTSGVLAKVRSSRNDSVVFEESPRFYGVPSSTPQTAR